MSDNENTYRDGTAAGWKGNSNEARANSIAAAAHVNKDLGRRHRQVMERLALYGSAGATPEQVAADLRVPVHVVRPRCGELVKRGLLFQVGRRPGDLGCMVTAYSTVRPEAQAVAA